MEAAAIMHRRPSRMFRKLDALQERIRPLRRKYESLLGLRDGGAGGLVLKLELGAVFHELSDLEEDEAGILWELRQLGIYSRHEYWKAVAQEV